MTKQYTISLIMKGAYFIQCAFGQGMVYVIVLCWLVSFEHCYGATRQQTVTRGVVGGILQLTIFHLFNNSLIHIQNK